MYFLPFLVNHVNVTSLSDCNELRVTSASNVHNKVIKHYNATRTE
jgi:hypothetical protein